MLTIKSYLFVPGNRPERIRKVLTSEAHAIIIDLEDAVPPNEKANVRKDIQTFLESHDFSSHKKLYLRINGSSTTHYEQDIKMIAQFPDVSVMLPKTNSPSDIHKLEDSISSAQFILPLIETAKGILSAYEIAVCSKRVTQLAFGAVDYCSDLNISPSAHGQELIYPRSVLVVASRAAGLEPPIDTVCIDISNKKKLIEEILQAKSLGLFSKLCIHPAQLEQVNTLFAPSPEEIIQAKRIVKAFEQALTRGEATIQVNRKMIDLPIYNQALAILKKN